MGRNVLKTERGEPPASFHFPVPVGAVWGGGEGGGVPGSFVQGYKGEGVGVFLP